MKKLLFLLAFSIVAFGAQAQVLIGLHSYSLGAAPNKYTSTRTITNSGVDTVGSGWAQYRNSVGYQHVATKTSGNPALSYLTTWASKDSNQTGPYYIVAVDTIRNVSGAQVFNHDMGPCGVGNPARWYMTTMQGAGTAVWTLKSTELIR